LKDVVHDAQQKLKRWPDGFSLAYGGVPMNHLLTHFCIRHKTVPRSDQALEENLSLTFVRLRSPDEVYRNIRIDKDQV
jgi:hypothetical protein